MDEIVLVMYCKRCGKEVSDDSNYCKYCGEYIGPDISNFNNNINFNSPFNDTNINGRMNIVNNHNENKTLNKVIKILVGISTIFAILTMFLTPVVAVFADTFFSTKTNDIKTSNIILIIAIIFFSINASFNLFFLIYSKIKINFIFKSADVMRIIAEIFMIAAIVFLLVSRKEMHKGDVSTLVIISLAISGFASVFSVCLIGLNQMLLSPIKNIRFQSKKNIK